MEQGWSTDQCCPQKVVPPNKRQRLESSQLDVPLLPSSISPPLFTITATTRPKHLPQLGSNTLGELRIYDNQCSTRDDSGSPKVFLTELDQANRQQLDSEHLQGLRDSPNKSTTIVSSSPVKVVNEYEPTRSQGAQQAGAEGYSSSGRTSSSRVLLPYVHYSQENWGTMINHQFERIEPLS